MGHQAGITVQIRNQEESKNQLVVGYIKSVIVEASDTNKFVPAIDLPGFA